MKRKNIETKTSNFSASSSKPEICSGNIKFTGKWALPGKVDISLEAIRKVFPPKKLDEKLVQLFHCVAKRNDGKVMESTSYGREGFKRCNRLIDWKPCFVKLKVFSTKDIPQAGNCRLYFAAQHSKSNEALTVPHYIDFKAHAIKSKL